MQPVANGMVRLDGERHGCPPVAFRILAYGEDRQQVIAFCKRIDVESRKIYPRNAGNRKYIWWRILLRRKFPCCVCDGVHKAGLIKIMEPGGIRRPYS